MSSEFSKFKYENHLAKKVQLLRFVWKLVWMIAFRPTPRWALHGWRRFLLRLFGGKIGAECRVSPSCFVWAPWNLTLGDYSALGDNVDCYSMDRIVIGSKVAVSQRAFLCTGTHETTSLRRPLITAPISIGDHCWIAAEAIVLPDVSISEGTVVGARSVVTCDLPAWMICAGHPCKPIRPRVLKDNEFLQNGHRE